MKTSLETQTITFEQPLNDAIRICLRLEHLFIELDTYMHSSTLSSSRIAVPALLEVLNVIDRPDLKSKLTQTLMQQASALTQLQRSPHVNIEELNNCLNKLNQAITVLHNTRTKIGDKLRQNEFLNHVRMQLNTPGGACDFTTPMFALWLKQSVSMRHHHLKEWQTEFQMLREVSELLLHLIRQSADPLTMTAQEGFYQQSLNPSVPYQLVQITIPIEMNVFPEISVGKHRMAIRFLSPDFHGARPTPIRKTIKFDLNLCKI